MRELGVSDVQAPEEADLDKELPAAIRVEASATRLEAIAIRVGCGWKLINFGNTFSLCAVLEIARCPILCDINRWRT